MSYIDTLRKHIEDALIHFYATRFVKALRESAATLWKNAGVLCDHVCIQSATRRVADIESDVCHPSSHQRAITVSES